MTQELEKSWREATVRELDRLHEANIKLVSLQERNAENVARLTETVVNLTAQETAKGIQVDTLLLQVAELTGQVKILLWGLGLITAGGGALGLLIRLTG